MEKKLLYLCTGIVLCLSFGLNALPHFESGLPLHSDSYDAIAVAQKSIEEGFFFMGDPYAPPEGKGPAYIGRTSGDFQIGFTAVLIAFSLIPGIDALSLHYFLPWLFSLLAFCGSFILLRKTGVLEKKAFIASLFIFFIPSSQQFLGPIFMVASSLGLALLSFLLATGIDFLERNTRKKEFVIIFIVTGVIYPPCLAAGIIALFVYSLSSKEIFEKNRQKIILAGAGLAALFIMYILFLLVASGFDPVKIIAEHGALFIFAAIDFALDQFLLKEAVMGGTPFLWVYMGILPFIASALAIALFGLKKLKHKTEWNKAIMLPAIFFTLLSALNTFLGKGLLIPAERNILFASYFMLLATGLLAAELFAKIAEKNPKNRELLFIAFLLAVSLFAMASQPFRAETIEKNISENEMDSIEWIKANTGEKDLIFAAPYISKPIKVLTQREVACTTSTRFGCPPELNYAVASFFFAPCKEKQKIIEEYFMADYVLVQKVLVSEEGTVEFPEQDCGFLEKRFEGENITIYKTKLIN